MDIIQAIIVILIGYLFGCFQTSYFISRKFGKQDIREIGSGNAGASNVTSEMGWKFGILTGISDVFKAFIPVKLVVLIFPASFFQQIELMALAGTGAILGHIYPFFMNFRGGKGIACYIGLLLAINWQLGIAVIISLILITVITNYISIGSIFLYSIIPVLAYSSGDYSIIVIQCAIVLFIVGIIKHWINIQRIVDGTETGFWSVYKKNKTK